MKFRTMLAAAAPIALLAACGDDVDSIERADSEVATGAVDDTAEAEADAATPATRLDDAGDVSGTYTVTDADGNTRSITLDGKAGTYEYTNDAGEKKTGKFTRADDGYRFIINDYNGSIGYFAFSDGDLIRLPNDATLTADDGEEITVSGERYRRDDPPFSREPELGSPVVPEDLRNN